MDFTLTIAPYRLVRLANICLSIKEAAIRVIQRFHSVSLANTNSRVLQMRGDLKQNRVNGVFVLEIYKYVA